MAGKDELYDDKSLDQQVHDAYGRIELNDEAQDRMLANLLAAQKRAVSEQATTVQVEAPESPESEVEQPKRGAVVRMRWLPMAAAAAIVTALVVVSVAGMGAKQGANMSASEERVATDAAPVTERAQEGAASKSESTAMAPEVDAAEEAELLAQDDRIHTLAGLYPRITIAKGQVYMTLIDGVPMEQVDASEIGDLVGEATASEADDSSEKGPVGCKVYQLKQDDGAFAVQYAGEDSYWRCMPIE